LRTGEKGFLNLSVKAKKDPRFVLTAATEYRKD
jgi:hypothetical protein